jgi:ABC-type sugar transport system ATPase subunit
VAGLRLDAVDCRYGDLPALVGIDLTVADGEVLAVVGPSGSGKSTLLRVIAGLEPAAGGRVTIGDREVTAVPAARRDVAMIFQGYALFPHLSVADNIGFGLRVRKVDRSERATKVRAVAEAVGCVDLLDRRPDQLSGGEAQRVALARALVRDPAVLLLDEPLSHLDDRLRVQMRLELHRLHRRVATTMVLVTHDQGEALTLGDRVAVLDGGRIQQVGTPDDVYWRPANVFVAGFVGSPAMNLVPASIADGEVRAGPWRFPFPPRDGSSGSPAPSGVRLGVRPEHLVVTPAADGHPSAPSGAAPATVVVVEPAGADTYLYLDGPLGLLTARVVSPVAFRAGDAVTVSVPSDRWYLFGGDGSALGSGPTEGSHGAR